MLGNIRDILWGLPTVGVIAVFALYFTVRLKCVQLTGLGEFFKVMRNDFGRKSDGISAAATLATALGGTVGIGSITGVGVAVAYGGAGSVFWMWVTGFLCSALKYAEINVAVRHRSRKGGIYCGGAMYALKDAGLKFTAVFFCIACIAASFGIGCFTQASAVTDEMAGMGMSRIAAGAVLAGAVAFASFGGRRSIARVSSYTVPVAGVIYIAAAVLIIALNIRQIPSAFSDIVLSAFGLRQAAAGFAGYGISAALRVGVTRGIYSTEAGMGSSPLVHSASDAATPRTQGLWGLAETYADTFVFSTLTAFALLSSGSTTVGGMFASAFGFAGSTLLTAMLAVFGFASIISWCFYSESCICFLSEKKLYPALYRAAAIAATFAGAIMPPGDAWAAADILGIVMMVPNLILLFIRRKEICDG